MTEVERLRAALEPFARAAIEAEAQLQRAYGCAEIPPTSGVALAVSIADLRRARSAMMDQPQTPQPVLPTSDDPSTPFAG